MLSRLFGWALAAHPRWIRDAYGVEMRAAFEAGLGTRRGAKRVFFGLRALLDAVISGLEARRRDRRLANVENGMGRGTMRAFDFVGDLKVAIRSLARAPGFSAAAVIVLALGIGANTALFSAVRSALLAPPPFPDPDRIVLLDLTDSSTVEPTRAGPTPWSYPKFRALAEAEGLPLTARAAFGVRTLTLTGAGDATVLGVEVATPGYLDVMGVTPLLGRRLLDSDDREGAELVALLSHSLWMERFAGDPSMVGRSIRLNAQPVEVVGVLPAGFAGLSGNARLWITPHASGPLISPVMVRAAQAHWMQGVGRMGEAATLDGLREAMVAVGRAAEAVAPSSDASSIRSATARSLMDVRVGDGPRRSLLVLGIASALLLLVACANLGGLLAARALFRRREAAVRVALGASRWRVAGGPLAESVLLALAGGAASIAVALFASRWLAQAWPATSLSSAWNVDVVGLSGGLQTAEIAFAGLLAAAVGLALGVVPLFSWRGLQPGGALRAHAPGSGGVPAQRLRSVLVGGEIAVALVLLVGAGMLLRSLHALESVERGYDPNGLLSFSVQSPRGSAWAEDPAGFHEAIEARVAALPGVTDVGIGCVAPVAGHCMITGVLQAGEREWEAGSRPPVGIHYVGDGWFDALRTSVLEGRVFDSRDQEGSEPVVVLSRTAADELFPEGDALGSPIAMGVSLTPGDEGGTARIVGIVDDVLYDRPRNGLMAEAYVSHRQDDSYGTFIVRTGGDPLSLVPGVRAAVRELAPDVPVVRIRTLDEIEARAMAETRLLGGLLSAVAALAMLLACTGVWAAVSFSVARRRREFGVRLALGAPPTGMTASVVRSELLRAGAGVLVGVLVAAWGQRVLTALLFEVQPGDPWAFGGGAALLLAVAGLAAWIPARGAARVPPTVSLRAE